jgi:hypothetical protein
VSDLAQDRGEPRWIRDGLRLWFTEIRLLFVTLWTFVTAPRRFGAEWASGKLVAMNPVGVVLASATVLLPADYGLQRVLGWDRRPNVSVWIELARASRPYLFAALTGLVVHLVLRALGSRRLLSTTVGLLFYGIVLSWVLWCVGLVVCYFTGAGSAVPNILTFLTLGWVAVAFDGAHGIRWWWCACVLAVIGYGLIFGINAVMGHAGLT